MGRHHEMLSEIKAITGRTPMQDNDALVVAVLGDEPEMIPVIRRRLEAAGKNFIQSRHRTFKGAFFTVPIRNVGTAFAADWEWA